MGALYTCCFTQPSPSDTRSSQGWGMVGRLSLVSMTITVRVAEPTRAGLPLSVAISTSLDTEHSQGAGPRDRNEPWEGQRGFMTIPRRNSRCAPGNERDARQGLNPYRLKMGSWTHRCQVSPCFSPDFPVQDSCGSDSACSWVYME